MSVRAPVGTVGISNHYTCIGRCVFSIKSKENISQEFTYQFLLYLEDKWVKLAQGGIFGSIKSDTLKKIKITIPNNLEEQQKIASFLTTIDDKIEEVNSQIELSKEWKKGLMQKLFIQIKGEKK